MSEPPNDTPNPPPARRRLVPLIGILHDDGRLERLQVVELLPHPLDIIRERRRDDR